MKPAGARKHVTAVFMSGRVSPGHKQVVIGLYNIYGRMHMYMYTNIYSSHSWCTVLTTRDVVTTREMAAGTHSTANLLG